MIYRLVFRPLLFCFRPEAVHHFVFRTIKIGFAIPGVSYLVNKIHCPHDEKLAKEIMGLKFKNPVGLAAGFDKDALLFNELSTFGFSFIEIGTLTPLPQPGNDRPRMFRLPAHKALINRMGFNNSGVNAAVKRLRKKNKSTIIGGNIGKNKDTPLSEAVNDYIICFNALFEFVDYFAVNVSSPNTSGLRGLQEKEPLQVLLQSLQQINLLKPKPKPLLLKIAPDLTDQQIDEVIEIVKKTKLTGIIATNTTISREGIEDSHSAAEAGGLSGLPLKAKATSIIRTIRNKAGKDLVIIGVGGIFSADDVVEKLDAGADLVQVYTGFIYEGPSMVKKLCKGLLKKQ